MTSPLFEQPWPEGEFRFWQMGFVVDDILAAARRWAAVFGVGPFHVMPRNAVECSYYGKPAVMDTQIAVAQAGPTQIELIRNFGGSANVFTDAFGADGHGFHQVCTITPDFDAKRDHYESHGYAAACEVEARGMRVAFYDTFADFGFYTEVVEHNDGFLAQLTGISSVAAGWDGTDPVRILTRDGYRLPDV